MGKCHWNWWLTMVWLWSAAPLAVRTTHGHNSLVIETDENNIHKWNLRTSIKWPKHATAFRLRALSLNLSNSCHNTEDSFSKVFQLEIEKCVVRVTNDRSILPLAGANATAAAIIIITINIISIVAIGLGNVSNMCVCVRDSERGRSKRQQLSIKSTQSPPSTTTPTKHKWNWINNNNN